MISKNPQLLGLSLVLAIGLLDAGEGADRYLNGYNNSPGYKDGALLERVTWGLFIDTGEEAR